VTPGDRLSNAQRLRASPFPVHDWTRRCHCCESPAAKSFEHGVSPVAD
jgi:hypothetical protein